MRLHPNYRSASYSAAMKSRMIIRWVILLLIVVQTNGQSPSKIDRHALVTRHHPKLHSFDSESPFSVGNGEFAFTVDATGLQTFPELYEKSIPLGTFSQWGWHIIPNTNGWSPDRFKYTEYDVSGRKVGYADIPGNKSTPEIQWLRSNPHRLHLGCLGFKIALSEGKQATINDFKNVEQTLSLWHGSITSCFKIEDNLVEVITLCHPVKDLIAIQVKSPLVKQGRVRLQFRFPYGTGASTGCDWSQPDRHQTVLTSSSNKAVFSRKLDSTEYFVGTEGSPGQWTAESKQSFLYVPAAQNDTFEMVCHFSSRSVTEPLPTFSETQLACQEHWHRFWQQGGAIDLSESKDPRWRELERRIVLSQYLTAIQCAGSNPPQESGLTFNSWEGKFHLEMHWWHAAHFALWNRIELLEKSLDYYSRILPRAKATAERQGYSGARWPKMTGPEGIESPSSVGPFLVWQQPHPIYFAELYYRARPDKYTLEKFNTIVQETAEFMASFPLWNDSKNCYVLGPILQCAQEIFPKNNTYNPTFELTYWRWGLAQAQQWRQRQGLPKEAKWDQVLSKLAKPAVSENKYLFAESTPDCYSDPKWIRDHPSVTAALGMLPGNGIDPIIMRNTLLWIWNHWNWPQTWGWDYPMIAMCAARLGLTDVAVDALLLDTPKNRYRVDGHNHQRPGLTIYLPGNGGLLFAVAMMAAGWDGAPDKPSPGFPDRQWKVRWEGLSRMP